MKRMVQTKQRHKPKPKPEIITNNEPQPETSTKDFPPPTNGRGRYVVVAYRDNSPRYIWGGFANREAARQLLHIVDYQMKLRPTANQLNLIGCTLRIARGENHPDGPTIYYQPPVSRSKLPPISRPAPPIPGIESMIDSPTDFSA